MLVAETLNGGGGGGLVGAAVRRRAGVSAAGWRLLCDGLEGGACATGPTKSVLISGLNRRPTPQVLKSAPLIVVLPKVLSANSAGLSPSSPNATALLAARGRHLQQYTHQ